MKWPGILQPQVRWEGFTSLIMLNWWWILVFCDSYFVCLKSLYSYPCSDITLEFYYSRRKDLAKGTGPVWIVFGTCCSKLQDRMAENGLNTWKKNWDGGNINIDSPSWERSVTQNGFPSHILLSLGTSPWSRCPSLPLCSCWGLRQSQASNK